MGSSPSNHIERVTDMHQRDQNVGLLKPWVSMTPTSELNKEADYFCVATWGTMGAWRSAQFLSLTGGSAVSYTLFPEVNLLVRHGSFSWELQTSGLRPSLYGMRARTWQLSIGRVHISRHGSNARCGQFPSPKGVGERY